jgi:hypothetical protein
VEEEFLMKMTKDEIMTLMMEVKHLENTKCNVSIVKDLAILKVIVGKNKINKINFMRKREMWTLFFCLVIQLTRFPRRYEFWTMATTTT